MGRNHRRDEEAARRRNSRRINNNVSFNHAEQLKPLLSLYIQDTAQKGESRDYTRLKNGGRVVGTENWSEAFLFS